MELAEAARLRALVAEERPPGPELHGLRKLVHAVLDVRAADRRGGLGAQGELAPALVGEREHLLLDDVRRRPDPAREQLEVLERRGLDPRVPGAGERAGSDRVHAGPRRRLGGQDVERAARGLKASAHARARLDD
jgi:hypothetical protein